MATDPNKKTLRHFQCRDYLWETFEQMSAELECSVDYLINESMRQYARSRGQGGPRPPTDGSIAASNVPLRESSVPVPPAPRPSVRPGAPALPSRTPGPGTAPPRPGAIPSMPVSSTAPAPRIPALHPAPGSARPTGTPALPTNRPNLPPVAPRVPASPPLPRPSIPPAAPLGVGSHPPRPGAPAIARVPSLPTSPRASTPPPPPAAPPPMPTASGHGAAMLTAIYQGERFPVTKEEFIIGRGQKTSDLVIKDSNVSRRHAVVVLHNGQYWMVDQQSTNGVEFMGAKIDRKRIDDGDVFKICDYEIAFTYS